MFLDSIHHGLYSSRLRRHSQNGLFNSRIIGATLPKDQKACLPRYDQCKTIATKTDNIPSENRKLLSVVQCLVQERKSLLSELETCPPERYKVLGKRIGELGGISAAWDEYQAKLNAVAETKVLMSDPDPEMNSLANEEFKSLQQSLTHLTSHTFPSLLVPSSPTSGLSAVLELQAGVGGTEACLFLEDLLRMYTRYANSRAWETRVLNRDNDDGTTMGGVMVEVSGEGAYDALRWESGVHRIQRVPVTETSGRMHTSTVTVAVFPLSGHNDAGSEPLYDMKDVKIEVMRARGAGGQHVNKTESAVRITHVPSGITVSMQDERSQHINKAKAFRILEARLLHRKMTAEAQEYRDNKRRMFKSADRREKMRTYNAAQDRVTDHRVNFTISGLRSMFDGRELHRFIEELKQDHHEKLVKDMLDCNGI